MIINQTKIAILAGIGVFVGIGAHIDRNPVTNRDWAFFVFKAKCVFIQNNY